MRADGLSGLPLYLSLPLVSLGQRMFLVMQSAVQAKAMSAASADAVAVAADAAATVAAREEEEAAVLAAAKAQHDDEEQKGTEQQDEATASAAAAAKKEDGKAGTCLGGRSKGAFDDVRARVSYDIDDKSLGFLTCTKCRDLFYKKLKNVSCEYDRLNS